jgi:hypothetical protein
VRKFKVWKILTFVVGLCYAGFMSPAGVVAGVWRQILVMSV